MVGYRLRKACYLALLATMPVACTMVPDYKRPEFSAAGAWEAVPGYQMPVGQTALSRMSWSEFFEDPDIQQVIASALINNKDLQTAALNIEEARLIYGVSRGDLLPNIDLFGDGSISRTSRQSGGGQQTRSDFYRTALGVTAFELDLFGRIRSQNQAQLNELLASGQAYAVVQNALIAEVVNAYLQYLADLKLLGLTRKTLAAQENSLDILTRSKEKGVATQQDVSRAETAVETARVNLHQYSRFVVQDKNALFLLMGLPNDDTLLPASTLDELRLPSNLVSRLPSEVLLMRPDVRQAEYQLLARNADIGAARAAFFPSISLTGSYGFASTELDKLFAGGASGAWTFLPEITLPIFHGGRNRANLQLAQVRKEKAVVAYEQTVQAAFREVSDELAARATLDKQWLAQNRLVAAAQKVYDLSRARYDVGIDSFLSVLDAQRELYSAETTAILFERQRLSNLINLYKALGGGSYDDEEM